MPQLPAELLAHFIDRDDFCYPEWEAILAKIEAENNSERQKVELVRECALTWLDRLQEKLGLKYLVQETPHFLLLANPVDKPMEEYFAFVEKMRVAIQEALPGVARKEGRGKHVILIFDEPEDFFRYIAPFYPAGEHPAPQSVFLWSSGYRHIAILYNRHAMLRIVANQFTRLGLSYLPLPRWLNNSLSAQMANRLVQGPRFIVTKEICEKHQAHWNETTIQEFWRGESWFLAEPSFDLSYGLAEILLRKIEEDVRPSRAALLSFIGEAHRRDAGQEAAWKHLKIILGELVADFLGAGDWSPQPRKWKKSEEPAKTE
jgi:hypothetical protein